MRRLTVTFYRRNEPSYNFLKEKDQNNFVCAKIHFYVPNGSREKRV